MAVFIKPDGSVVELDQADFAAAAQRGYRAETPEEAAKREAGDHPVRAGLEGAARTATFGLSDVFQAGALEAQGRSGKEIKERAEANPVASTLGEVAGFFTPGPKAATRLGEAASASASTKTARRLVQGGVEGGLFGLGSAISENSFGDPDLAGEHVAAGTLGGILAGAAVTPILGTVADTGRSALIKAFGGRALKDTLNDLAEKSVMRQILMPSDLAKKSTGKNLNEMGRFGIDEGFFKGVPTTAEVSGRARTRAEKAWQDIDAALQGLDQKYTVAQPGPNGVINMTQFDAQSAAARLQPMLRELENNPAATSARDQLQGMLNRFSDPATSPKSFADAWKTASWMWEKIGESDTGGKLKGMYKRLRKEFQDEIFTQAGKLDPKLGEALQNSNRQYYLSNRISELAQKTSDRGFQNRQFSLTDYLVGVGAGHLGAMMHGPAGLAVGVMGATANKFLRERGGFVVGSALDAMSKSKVVDRMAAGLKKSIQAGLAGSSYFGGPFRATLETAAAQGSMDLLATHLQLAKANPDYLAAVNMPDEDPSTIPEYTDKAHRLGQVFRQVDDNSIKIDSAIESFLSGSVKAPKDHKVTRADYDRVSTQLQQLVNNQDLLSKNLSELAPQTSALAGITMLNAAKFLDSKMPRDPNKGIPLALQRSWQPSQGDLRTWFRYVDAVANPAGVFDQMGNGRLTPEAIEALHAVYPKLYQEFKDRMTSRLADQQTPLTRKHRAALGGLLGGIDNPAVVSLIQTIHKKASPPNMARSDGRQQVDAVKNEQTQAQRLENRNQP